MKVAVSSTIHADVIVSHSAFFSLFSGVEDLEGLSHMLHTVCRMCHEVCLHCTLLNVMSFIQSLFHLTNVEKLGNILFFGTFPLILWIPLMSEMKSAAI